MQTVMCEHMLAVQRAWASMHVICLLAYKPTTCSRSQRESHHICLRHSLGMKRVQACTKAIHTCMLPNECHCTVGEGQFLQIERERSISMHMWCSCEISSYLQRWCMEIQIVLTSARSSMREHHALASPAYGMSVQDRRVCIHCKELRWGLIDSKKLKTRPGRHANTQMHHRAKGWLESPGAKMAQHPEFARDSSTYYYSDLNQLIFRDRTGTGAF